MPDRGVARLMIIDAQSIRASQGEERGYDGFKKVQGRKREILVESTGLILACSVHRANQMENRGAVELIRKFRMDLLRAPQIILGDSAYGKPPFETECLLQFNIYPTVKRAVIEMEASKLPRSKQTKVKVVKASNLKPLRWKVERTFAWFNHYRRLARDYEKLCTTSQAQIYICGLQLALHRMRRNSA